MTGITHKKSGGSIIDSFAYSYDNVGNRTAVTENGGDTVSWGYDAAYRLTSETRTGSNAYASTFTYDSAGNRLTNKKNGATTTFTYDMADQLSTSVDGSGTTTYTYDNAGNQTLVVAPGSQRTTSTWNDENKRTQVQTPGGTTMDCEYRFDGLRYEKQASGATTRFLYDGQNYLAETDGTGSVKLVLTNKPNRYGSLISQYVNIFGSTFVPVYQHYDALGSTAAITTSAQAVVNSYHYGAWGDIVSSTEGIFNNFKWVGELGYYYDMQVEDYYVRARNYSPRQARWYSQDPLFWPYRGAARELFAYVKNNPCRFIDPLGLEGTKAQAPIEIDIGYRFISFPGYVFAEEKSPGRICVHAHLRRAFHLPQDYKSDREVWNSYMESKFADYNIENVPERGIWSSDDRSTGWFMPNLARLLNGCDGNNAYGGSYSYTTRVEDDRLGDYSQRVDVEDDDYLEVIVTPVSLDEHGDPASTKCWHSVGSGASEGLRSVQHVAGSSEVCVNVNCMVTGIEVALKYGDPMRVYGTKVVFGYKWGTKNGHLTVLESE